MEEDAEYYFIQLLFAKNRELLKKDNREIYDLLFEKYQKYYKKGTESEVSLGLINDTFIDSVLKGTTNAI